MVIAVAQCAARAAVLRQGFWMYPAAGLVPLVLTFVLLEVDAEPATFGIAMAALALAYVIAPPLALYLRSRIPVWEPYELGEFSLPLHVIAYPMAIAGMAAAARLALAEPETADFETVASVPLLIAMGLALGQYVVSAVVLRHELWLYLANVMASLVIVFGLAHFRADPPFYGVALAALGLVYAVLPVATRRVYARMPLSDPFQVGRYSSSFFTVGHVLALAGMHVAGTLAVTAEGQPFDSIPLIIAMSLALSLYVASAAVLREGRWMYAAAVLLLALSGFVLERMDVPPEWYGVALVALACAYVLGPQLVDFPYRHVRSIARPFQANTYTRPLLEMGYLVSGIGILAAVVQDVVAGMTALSLAGALYLVSAFGLRRREFLHAGAVAWAAAYVVGLTLTPFEARHWGLPIMGASTAALAVAPLLKLSWHQAGLASTGGAPWHEKAQSIAGSPACAFYALSYAGMVAAVILTWVDIGTWQDNPLLMTTLAWASALLAYSTWVFRAPGFLWAALISADLASVAGMLYANPNMTSADMAIRLTPASYALALGAAWTWRLTREARVKLGSEPAADERMPIWAAWIAPFLAIALTHILASLAMTAGDSEAGLVVALAYFVLLAAASAVTSTEALAWGALSLAAVAFGHGMNLASVEVRAGILYAALSAVAVRGAGYVVQRTLDIAEDRAPLVPLSAWQRPLTLGAYMMTAGAFLAAVAILQHEGDLTNPGAHWSLATMFVAGLNLSIAALAERRAWLAYLGSGLILVAALLEAVHFEMDQPQIYVLPVGLYLVAVGQLERHRLGWMLTMPLVGTALLLLLGTTLLQSWGLLGAEGQEVMYGLAYLSESLLVLVWGILQRVRLSFFVGIGSTVAAVLTLILRSTIPAASALDVDQLAMIFGGLGAGLLTMAVYLERRREILLVQGREWLARIDSWS